jgi:ketosteroid isomerase-like protein
MAESDLDQVIEQYQLALGEFVKGNPEPVLKFFSQRDVVSLANPFGPAVRGPKQVEEVARGAASKIRDGKIDNFETITKMVTPDMAFFVWVEHGRAKVGNRDTLDPVPVRVTVIFIPEDGTWKVVHRHADTIVSARPAESMIQK